MSVRTLLCALCVLALACDDDGEARVTEAEEGNVVAIDGEDPEMAAAVERARSTVGELQAALSNPGPGQSGFAVKKRFEDGDQSEYMWLVDVRFDGTTFTGRLDNDPAYLRNVQAGTEHSVRADEIYDWLFMDNGQMRGGHSIAVLQRRAAEP